MTTAYALALFAVTTGNAYTEVPVSNHIQKVMAEGDGLTAASAFKVSSVKDEYEILQVLGLEIVSQSLVVLKKKSYDVLTAKDDAGVVRELWFDVSRFYR